MKSTFAHAGDLLLPAGAAVQKLSDTRGTLPKNVVGYCGGCKWTTPSVSTFTRPPSPVQTCTLHAEVEGRTQSRYWCIQRGLLRIGFKQGQGQNFDNFRISLKSDHDAAPEHAERLMFKSTKLDFRDAWLWSKSFLEVVAICFRIVCSPVFTDRSNQPILVYFLGLVQTTHLFSPRPLIMRC
jgi:hypothetical protein